MRDLETQLAQLKSYQREQATKLGTVVADKEALQLERAQLQAGRAHGCLPACLPVCLPLLSCEGHWLQIEGVGGLQTCHAMVRDLPHGYQSLLARLWEA